MSQAGVINTVSGPVPPQVPTSFVADVGTAVPAANTLGVPGGTSTANTNNGIRTEGVGATLTFELTNRSTGTTTTPTNALTPLITFPLGATPGVYYVNGNVQAFNSTTPAGAGYTFAGAFRTTGGAATIIAAQYHDEFEEAAFAAADIFLTASGNNAVLSVQGPVGLSTDWNALLEYRMVT